MQVDLSPRQLGILASLARMDARKRRRQVDRFRAFPDQSQEHAAAVLSEFTDKAEFAEDLARTMSRLANEASRATVVA